MFRLALSLLLATLLVTPFTASAGVPIFETPDRKNLLEGAHALKKGYANDAVSNFQESARYGNKDAQMTLGMMYVRGTGVEMDWARGYAWLALASTHGKADAVSARDQVKAQLKPEELPKAEQWLSDLQKEFGDQAAIERREAWVRREKRKLTGSRTGSSAGLQIEVADATGYRWQIAGPKYFELLNGEYILEFRQRMGEVTFGELELVDD